MSHKSVLFLTSCGLSNRQAGGQHRYCGVLSINIDYYDTLGLHSKRAAFQNRGAGFDWYAERGVERMIPKMCTWRTFSTTYELMGERDEIGMETEIWKRWDQLEMAGGWAGFGNGVLRNEGVCRLENGEILEGG